MRVVNERLFTQNELFGNDGTLMSNALKKLNAMSSFDEVKTIFDRSILVSQNWLTENKKKKLPHSLKW